MSKRSRRKLLDYASLLNDVKNRIRQAQVKAMLSVNSEMIRMYWDIGRIIDDRQNREGWGTAVIPRLAGDLHNELPEVKGFSERNIGRMIAFFRAYPQPSAILPQLVAKLPNKKNTPKKPPKSKAEQKPKVPQSAAHLPENEILPQAVAKLDSDTDYILWRIPWGHHAMLLEKIKEPEDRLWYMQEILQNGWSRNVLTLMIQSEAHARQGNAISNFPDLLSPVHSDLVTQTLKDPYIFDFLTLEEPFHERELETQLLHQLQRFLLELGQGFSFVGRQFRVEVDDEDFHIDLLFYHLRLRCFVVIDLKKGAFKAEYAGKMNFYLNVVDDQLRHETDAPSIGLILCQDRKRVIAEYALRGVSKPIGISEYELTRALPKELRSSLPSIEDIEAELGKGSGKKTPTKTRRSTKRSTKPKAKKTAGQAKKRRKT